MRSTVSRAPGSEAQQRATEFCFEQQSKNAAGVLVSTHPATPQAICMLEQELCKVTTRAELN